MPGVCGVNGFPGVIGLYPMGEGVAAYPGEGDGVPYDVDGLGVGLKLLLPGLGLGLAEI